MTNCTLYKNKEFQENFQNILRPGGLEITAKSASLAGVKAGSSVLDIGCGLGETLFYLKEIGAKPIGIDSNNAFVIHLKGINLEAICANATSLPFASEAFDFVILECVFSLIEEKEQAIAEIFRVLKPQGRLIVNDLYIREGKEKFATLPAITCVNGIETKEIFLENFQNNFKLVKFSDETPRFLGFLAEIVMNYGSMDNFWCSILGCSGAKSPAIADIKKLKMGYLISVWQKKI